MLITVEILSSKSCYIHWDGRFNSTAATIEMSFSTLTHLRPGQNGHRFIDDIFICILVNDFFFILIKISLTFAPKGPIDNTPASGAKPLSEPMLTQFTDAYMRH